MRRAMTPAELHELLRSRFGDSVVGLRAELASPLVEIRANALHEVCRFLRDDEQTRCDTLRCLTGVDEGDALRVVYFLWSYPRRHGVGLEVRLDREHPAVADVAVVRARHSTHGEVPKAVVVMQPGKRANAAEIQRFCADRLAPVMVPRVVTFSDGLPRTAGGKIAYGELDESP